MRTHGGIEEILRTRQFPGVQTRDTFGINNEFYDHKTKTWIDSRSKWNKAGFTDLKETVSGNNALEPVVKEQIKRQSHKKKLSKTFNMEGLK